MVDLFNELKQQPRAFHDLVEFYADGHGLCDLPVNAHKEGIILTGMGASYHAAWIGAFHLNNLGVPALAIEATDLLNYAPSLTGRSGLLVYISQSGTSGEVQPLLDQLDPKTCLAAVTNNPESDLAARANVVLPMLAGDEELIASKTYINTLAILWLLARRIGGVYDGSEIDALRWTAECAGRIVEGVLPAAERLLGTFPPQSSLIFLGHGPHAATSRHSAMVMSEWAKVRALSAGIGAFRHGFIEGVSPDLGALVFAPPGRTVKSALGLARELEEYGARVLLVENGCLRFLNEPGLTHLPVDEFLSPILDILPIQFYAEVMRRALGREPGFRYISKVVRRL